MKIIYTPLLVSVLSLTIFSCSKKINSGLSDSANQKYSRQLEMYNDDNTILSASTNENEVVLPKADTRFENAAAPQIKQAGKASQIIKLKNGKSIEVRQIEKSDPIYKSIIKKSEIPSAKKSEQMASGRLKTGIIIGAVGLLLLITAGFFGAASPVIYVVGAVLFVVGVVLILLDVL